MLYPDLGRLSLVCPTGMPAGPAQRYALGQRDVVEAILRNLGGGKYEDACRVAARWCSLNSEHRAACQTHQPWTDLTQAVFPGSRKPNPRDHEPEHPKDWFFYLCNRHARLVELRDLVKRINATRQYVAARRSRDYIQPRLKQAEQLRAAQRSRESHELFTPGNSKLVRRERIEELQRQLLESTRDMQRYEAEGAATWVTYDKLEAWVADQEVAAWVGEIAVLEAYMRGLYPNRQPLL